MAHDTVNAGAVEVAKLAQRMVAQYFGHVAAMYVALDPRSDLLATPGSYVEERPRLRHRRPFRAGADDADAAAGGL